MIFYFLIAKCFIERREIVCKEGLGINETVRREGERRKGGEREESKWRG